MKPLIALIDDETEIVDSLSDFLDSDYETIKFSNSKEFLQKVDTIKDLKLIITDYNMPGLNGIDLMKAVYSKTNSVIPFIIQSGYVDKKTALSAIDLGVYKILEKPLDPNILMSTIQELLVTVELEKNQAEIHKLTEQIHELYMMMRLTFLQYIPQEIQDKMVVDAPQGVVVGKMKFEDLLFELEAKLNELLRNEKSLTQIVSNRILEAAKR